MLDVVSSDHDSVWGGKGEPGKNLQNRASFLYSAAEEFFLKFVD